VDPRLVILVAASALLVVSIAYFIGSLFASARARVASQAGPETVPVPTSGADKAREAMLIPVDVQGWEPRPAATGPVVLESPGPDSLAASIWPHDPPTGAPQADATAAGSFDEREAAADDLDARLVELATATEAPPFVEETPPPAPGPDATIEAGEGLLPLETVASQPLTHLVRGDAVQPEPPPPSQVSTERVEPEALSPADPLSAPLPGPAAGSPVTLVEVAEPAADPLAGLRESLAEAPQPEPTAEPHGLLAWEPSPPPPAASVAYEPPAPVAYEPPATAAYEPPAPVAYEPPAPVAYEPPAPVAYEPPAPAAHEPPPAYDMVAPVELMFTDGPKRIGIRPGTATFLKYQRLAAVLLGDLKKARTGGS
jgi:hypothetical protein